MSIEESPTEFTSLEEIITYLTTFDVINNTIPKVTSRAIIAFNNAALKRKVKERKEYIRSQQPVHPDTQEIATFCTDIESRYPLYKTPSGLYLMWYPRENCYMKVTPRKK